MVSRTKKLCLHEKALFALSDGIAIEIRPFWHAKNGPDQLMTIGKDVVEFDYRSGSHSGGRAAILSRWDHGAFSLC